MRLFRGSRALATLAALAAPGIVHAQGYGLNEIGSCAIARGFANTSAPCRDASMVYWNPAAITTLDGNAGLIGAAMIAVSGDFTQDTTGRQYKSDISPAIAPHLFWAHHAPQSRVAYGIGVYVPYGLTSQWGQDFPGRFSAQKAAIQTLYGQPNIAFKLSPNWSIGGGPVIGYSALELNQSVDLSEQAITGTPYTFANFGIPRRTEFARVHATGNDVAFGFNVGIKGRLSPTWEFGARFLGPVKFQYEGDATFTQVNTGLTFAATVPGTPFVAGAQLDTLTAIRSNFASGGKLAPQGVKTELTHPAQFQTGLTYSGFANTAVSVEYTWLGWKSFEELPVNFQGGAGTRALIEDYKNSNVLRVGLDRAFTNGAAFRAGGTVASSAAPPETVTPLLPEQDRYTLNVGGGYPLSKRWTVDGAYAYVGTWGSRGRITERTSREQTAEQLNTGFFRLQAHILSVSLKATY